MWILLLIMSVTLLGLLYLLLFDLHIFFWRGWFFPIPFSFPLPLFFP